MIMMGPHSFRRNAITDTVNATNGNFELASLLYGNSAKVAKIITIPVTTNKLLLTH